MKQESKSQEEGNVVLALKESRDSRERERCAKIIFHKYGTWRTEKLIQPKDFEKSFTEQVGWVMGNLPSSVHSLLSI